MSQLQVISANRLADGIVVYYAGGGQWVERLDLALKLETQADLSAALALANADIEANKVVDVIEVPMQAQNQPVSMRDRIRMSGPSIQYRHSPRS